MSEQPLVRPMAKAQNKSITGEQQRPKKQRAFLARPQGRELICRREVAIAVLVDVGDGEIVRESGMNQDCGREQNRYERGDASSARRLPDQDEGRVAPDESDQTEYEGIATQGEGKEQQKTTNLRHGE